MLGAMSFVTLSGCVNSRGCQFLGAKLCKIGMRAATGQEDATPPGRSPSLRRAGTASLDVFDAALDVVDAELDKVRASTYWRAVCRKTRPPVITLLTIAVCVIVFYLSREGSYVLCASDRQLCVDQTSMQYIPGAGHEWYRSLSATFAHVSEQHLVMNIAMLLVIGSFFEVTEGIVHMLCVVWGASTIGFAFHGIFNRNPVRGASAAIYGVLFAQASLLVLNWNEMPWRRLRLFLLVTLAAVDIAVFYMDKAELVSYEAHGFGAAAGVSIALVLGRNVRLHAWEARISWAASLQYMMLSASVLVGGQLEAGLLAFVVAPVLLVYCVILTMRARQQTGGTSTASNSSSAVRTVNSVNPTVNSSPALRPPDLPPVTLRQGSHSVAFQQQSASPLSHGPCTTRSPLSDRSYREPFDPALCSLGTASCSSEPAAAAEPAAAKPPAMLTACQSRVQPQVQRSIEMGDLDQLARGRSDGDARGVGISQFTEPGRQRVVVRKATGLVVQQHI